VKGEASFNASLTARQPVSHTRNGDTEATLRAAGWDQLPALIVTGISDRSIIATPSPCLSPAMVNDTSD
jgi:hypothetical protein